MEKFEPMFDDEILIFQNEKVWVSFTKSHEVCKGEGAVMLGNENNESFGFCVTDIDDPQVVHILQSNYGISKEQVINALKDKGLWQK